MKPLPRPEVIEESSSFQGREVHESAWPLPLVKMLDLSSSKREIEIVLGDSLLLPEVRWKFLFFFPSSLCKGGSHPPPLFSKKLISPFR